MRIQILGSHVAEGFTQHLESAFRELGHEVRVVDYFPISSGARTLGPGVRAAQLAWVTMRRAGGALSRLLVERVLRAAERDGPWDLALAVYDWLTPDEVTEWKRRTGARTALWFPDAVSNLGRTYFLQAPYDAVFLKDPYMVSLFRDNLGKRVHYLPECFDPGRHRHDGGNERGDDRFRADVAIMGSAYPYRIELVKRLATHRNVRVWGPSAPRWCDVTGLEGVLTGEFVAFETKARALLGAKVVLNVLHPAEIWGVNVKTFEFAGIGAFQICEWRPGIAQLFVPGEEIETFRSLAELEAKLDRYLADDAARTRIAGAGRRRALAEHTYRHRIETLLDVVFRGGEAWTVVPPA
jgi:spore maturation protein CgeB